MADDIDLRRTFGVLTDEERFRILASISLGANTVEKIAAMTGYDNQVILKAVIKLETAGLVEKKEKAG
jgi:predicted transcriptional regulator